MVAERCGGEVWLAVHGTRLAESGTDGQGPAARELGADGKRAPLLGPLGTVRLRPRRTVSTEPLDMVKGLVGTLRLLPARSAPVRPAS